MTAVAQIETHLAKNPQDGRGWEVIAPVYVRMGRMDDAVKAYEAAIRYQAPDADRFANYGEVLVMAKDGLVSAEAQGAFEQAVKLDAGSPKARFYLARAAEQDGQVEKAKAAYTELLSASPADAPWVDAVKQELARPRRAACGSRAGRDVRDRAGGDRRHGGRPREPPGSPGRHARRMGATDALLCGSRPA